MTQQVSNQFRIFEKIKLSLVDPQVLITQCPIVHFLINPMFSDPISDGLLGSSRNPTDSLDATLQFLIDGYFNFNPKIMREIMGKKFSNKIRKDLDEIAERIPGVKIFNCRRHFENLFTICKTVKLQGKQIVDSGKTVSQFIQTQFRLNAPLAEQYTILAFLCHHQIDTDKRKLKDLQFEDVQQMTKCIMEVWIMTQPSNPLIQIQQQPSQSSTVTNITPMTVSSSNIPTSSTNNSNEGNSNQSDPLKLTMDFGFLKDLKSSTMSREDDFEDVKLFIAGGLFSKISEKKLDLLRDKLYGIVKALLSTGADFGQPRDFQDVFLDILEKFVEPLYRVLKLEDVGEILLLCHLIEQGFYTNKVLYDPKLSSNWEKFMKVISCLTEVMSKRLIVP